MKKLLYTFSLILVFACNSEDAGDCFQTSGTIVQHEIKPVPFNKILVNRNIELIVMEGEDFLIVIETGENLMNDVETVVVDGQLLLTDNNICNYVRGYGITKIYVTAPDLTEIRSSTQYDISSQGVLNYSNLKLISEDFNVSGTFTVGDFRLEVNSTQLSVVANNLSSFYITGQTENLFVGFYSGAGRFEAGNLVAQNIDVFHRGSNDMIVNPQAAISGELRSTGDVISKNQPPIVNVEEFYTGELIF
jgi:hypothetical protein